LANKNIKGITIEIGGETTGLQKALSYVNKKSSALTSELKDVERLLKFNPGNVEALAQKQKLLTDQISATTEKLNRLKDAEKQVQDQFAKGEISEEQYRTFRREIEFTEGSLNGMNNKFAKLKEEQEKVSVTTKQLENLLKATDNSLEEMSDTLGGDLIKAIRNGTAGSKELEDAFSKVSKEALGAEVDLEKLKRTLSQVDDGKSLKAIKNDLSSLANESKDAEKKVEGLRASFSDLGGGIVDASGSAGELVSTLVSTPWAAVGAGIAGIGTAAITAAIEFENADAKIQASLGVTKEEAKELGEVAEAVWKKGFGENVDAAARSVFTVSRNLKNIPKEELAKAAEYAQILADAMEVDVAESTRTVKQLMATFGMTAEQSFDYITKGFQDGLDFSGEFLDSINEYSPQFKALGMDATDMFTLFKQGAENGAFNLDKLGDIVKEFNIRVKDGSKTTAESFAGMSKETQALWKSFLDGKATGEEVFNAVVRELSKTEDKVKANQTAVGIFGTQWEDLEAEVVAAIDTSVNKLGEFEGATKRAGEALTDTTAAKVKEKTREIVSDLEELANKAIYTAIVMEEKQPQMAETFNIFAENVSQGTQKAVGAFLELNNQATTQVSLLKASVVSLSQETANEVSKTFGNMATLIRDSIAQRQEETIANMQGFFSTSSALTEAEEANIIAKINSGYETRSQIVTDGQNRILEILNTAKEQKRSITQVEATEINAIQAKMKTQAIEHMSKSEAEQKSILERLKAEASNITKQQAADVVKNSLKQKDESIKAAEEQYDKTVQEIIRQRDETKTISKEQADKLIAEAKRQRDNSVSEAQNMHRLVVGEAKKQAKGQVDEVDWATGKVKSEYEQMREMAWEWMKKMGGDIEKEWNEAEEFLGNIDLKEIGRNIVQGLIKGIKDINVKKVAADIGKDIKDGLTDFLDIHSPSRKMAKIGVFVGEGLIVGMNSKKGAVANAAQELASTIKYSFDESKKWIDDRKYYNQLSLAEELAAWERVQARYKVGTEERSQADREVYRVKKQINDELTRINDEYTAKIEASQQRLIEGEQKLTEEYNKAVVDRTKALTSFAGIFDEIKTGSEVTGQQLIQNLQGQVTTFAEWADNIKSLASKGIDEGLLEELRLMGPKAYAEIAALNTLTDEELQVYAALWKEKNELARIQATEELSGLKNDTQVKIEELRQQTAADLDVYKAEWIKKIQEIRTGTLDEYDVLNDSMKTIGNQSIQGLMDGLSEMTGPLLAQAKAIANAVKKTIQSALDIHSPSRETMWMGQMVGQGLIDGMEQSLKQIEYMSRRMAVASLPDIKGSSMSSANMGTGGVSSSGDTYGDIHLSISVKDMQEFNSVVDIFRHLKRNVKAK
jgi:phage-related minor tail protein